MGETGFRHIKPHKAGADEGQCCRARPGEQGLPPLRSWSPRSQPAPGQTRLVLGGGATTSTTRRRPRIEFGSSGASKSGSLVRRTAKGVGGPLVHVLTRDAGAVEEAVSSVGHEAGAGANASTWATSPPGTRLSASYDEPNPAVQPRGPAGPRRAGEAGRAPACTSGAQPRPDPGETTPRLSKAAYQQLGWSEYR